MKNIEFYKNLKNDFPASVVVFFVAIPLCLGIALASGAPLFSGLISGISVATVDFTDLPIVHGYEIGLRQLFQNLLSNGLKFSPPGRAPVISIWHEDAGNHWLLYIRDNGIGFDPAHKEKAFALFGRLNLRDEYPGTGLGLSICQRVADIHGGTITVQTAVDAGATFTLTLPKTPPAQ